MNGVISKLKGPPGTPVKVKYYRRGFAKGVEVTILREKIRVESVFHIMLPGAIGYIRLVRFGERSSEEMQAALDDLLGKQKARAVILDMRDNPGGLLRAGVDIADKFLADKKLIVYSEGNKEFSPRKDYFASGGAEDESYPLVALVGAGSASASEIVAGALQDHKRGVLVGEKTYGKGSVQQIMPLRTTDKQTQLRLTIAKYYLPSGRCIHEKGVEVDVEIKLPETHSWIIEKLAELRRKGVFEDYVRGTWERNKELCMRLAVSDEGNCANWPGFEEFYHKLHTQVERAEIRAEVRAITRRMVQDEQKRELVVDLQEDDVLQRGVLETLKKLAIDPATIAEYKGLPEKFKKREEEAREGAMLPEGAVQN
jgi:C-terminal peptidase prc